MWPLASSANRRALESDTATPARLALDSCGMVVTTDLSSDVDAESSCTQPQKKIVNAAGWVSESTQLVE